VPTATITADDIVRRYADDIAFVVDQDQATDIGTLADQLDSAAGNFATAGINGREDLETASVFLTEAHHTTDDVERAVFLRKADDLLYPIVWDMTQEYRSAVA
jgi:hypothetical protein